jgi:mannose-6-phosphate isomerase
MSTFVEKPWGSEIIWTHTDRYVGKLISVNAGARLSLQFHHKKDESIYVVEGTLNLHLENDAGEVEQIKMGPGKFARILTGRIHRFEALTDVKLIEVSTPELDDVVRLEDDYGREDTSAP